MVVLAQRLDPPIRRAVEQDVLCIYLKVRKGP